MIGPWTHAGTSEARPQAGSLRFAETARIDMMELKLAWYRWVMLGGPKPAVLTHRVWGLVIFVAMLFVVFQSIYTWAGPFMGWIEEAVASVQSLVAPLLGSWPVLQSLVVDGVIGGVGGVVVFLPQILILFFFHYYYYF